MKKFKVIVQSVVNREYWVDAESSEEAIQKVDEGEGGNELDEWLLHGPYYISTEEIINYGPQT